jgi:hypothetical protein
MAGPQGASFFGKAHPHTYTTNCKRKTEKYKD